MYIAKIAIQLTAAENGIRSLSKYKRQMRVSYGGVNRLFIYISKNSHCILYRCKSEID